MEINVIEFIVRVAAEQLEWRLTLRSFCHFINPDL